MAKNRKEQQKRRQDKQLKQRTTRKAKAKLAQATKNFPAGMSDFSNPDLLFWIGHGANYLASDYDEGIWNPVVPSIYEGEVLTPEALTQAILGRFRDDKSPAGKAVLAWTVQDKNIVYIFAKEALRAVKKADPSCDASATVRLPKHPAVWEVFHGIKNKVLQSRG